MRPRSLLSVALYNLYLDHLDNLQFATNHNDDEDADVSNAILPTTSPCHEQDADDWIRDVNYSADGGRLAVASNDCKVCTSK